MDLSQNISQVAEYELGALSRPAIIGKVAGSERSAAFREGKLALKGQGYPLKETVDFVKKYFEQNKESLKQVLDKNSIIVQVPSGSGKNLVTAVFAQLLEQEFGCSRLPAGLIARTHTYEAKLNLSVEKRVHNPIGYAVDEQVKKEVGKKKVFVLDDLIASGESAVKLKKTLNENGIRVEGFVNLVNVEKSYPTVNDISRFVNKLLTYTKPEQQPSFIELTKDVCVVFGEYTRQKLNRMERDLNSEKKALEKFEIIKLGAAIERNFKKEELQTYGKKKTTGLQRGGNRSFL